MNLEIILVRTVLVLTAALSVGISLWGGYYLLTGLMSWRRPMDYGRAPRRHPVRGADRGQKRGTGHWSADQQPAGAGVSGGAV